MIAALLACAGAPCASLGEGDRPRSILGTAMTFGERRPYGFGTMMFEPGSFDVEGVFADVVLNANGHGTAPLARTTAGTMSMRVGKKQVRYAAAVDFEDTDFANTYRRVKSGVIDGASMGLLFSRDGVTYEVDEDDGEVHQTVHKVMEVFEVTLTHQPVFRRTTAKVGTGLMEPGVGVVGRQGYTLSLPKDVQAKRDAVLAKRRNGGAGKAPNFKARALVRRPNEETDE